MSEQFPTPHCNVCRGSHGTAEHVEVTPVASPDADGGHHEQELHSEAMRKLVDIFRTEDLKFRNVGAESLVGVMEIGVLTKAGEKIIKHRDASITDKMKVYREVLREKK